MTADNTPAPDGPRPVDWDRLEAELGASRDGGRPRTTATDDAAGAAGAGTARVLVDSPEAQRPARGDLRDAERRPIVPPWLASRQEFTARARWAAGLAWHYGAYHATRSPKYAGRLAARAPLGAARVAAGWLRWLFDLEGEPVRQATVRAEDAEAYRHLSRQRDRRVRWRAVVSTALLAGLVPAAAGLALAPPWARWSVLAGLLAALGRVGQPADRPLLDTAVVIPQRPRLTSNMVADALAVLGISGIKGPESVSFPAPITRDGDGYRAEVDLPLGVVPGDVVRKRPELASALRRRLGCVWPEGDGQVHEGRLVLWVGDRDLAQVRGTGLAWKLARAGAHDLFTPVPFGVDARGRPVAVPLVQHNVLVGSLPGQGKTGAVVVLTSGAALDPLCELWVHELKGSGDLDPYATVAHRFVSGIDDDSVAYAADSLRLLRAEVMRRTGVLKQLPRELCPDKRVTRQIAERRSLGLAPLVCVVDECQNLFAHPAYGARAGEDAEFVIKIGRAFGVVLILATQRPDKESLPTGVSGNVSIRFCLKVAGQVENDMILGTSAYKRGLNAALFRPEVDAGIGYLVGATPTPTVACAAYLDVAARERVAARARALREAAGTLSGHALGEAPEPADAAARLLADVLAVVPASEVRVWNQTVVARLAELRPQVYAGWEAEQLTAALKPYGITVGQVWGTDPATGEGANRRGIDRQAVAEAATERERRRRGGQPP
jgi:S-DNA-T family DNA segregation ATPase FtsK/SpoIIIE